MKLLHAAPTSGVFCFETRHLQSPTIPVMAFLPLDSTTSMVPSSSLPKTRGAPRSSSYSSPFKQRSRNLAALRSSVVTRSTRNSPSPQRQPRNRIEKSPPRGAVLSAGRKALEGRYEHLLDACKQLEMQIGEEEEKAAGKGKESQEDLMCGYSPAFSSFSSFAGD